MHVLDGLIDAPTSLAASVIAAAAVGTAALERARNGLDEHRSVRVEASDLAARVAYALE